LIGSRWISATFKVAACCGQNNNAPLPRADGALVKAKLWSAFRRDQVLSMGVSAEQPMLMVAAAQDAAAITAQAQG
jgi:hypothetical protein